MRVCLFWHTLRFLRLFLFIHVLAALVDDKALLRLIDALAHHVVDGGIHAVHRRGSGLAVTVHADGFNVSGAKDILQTIA